MAVRTEQEIIGALHEAMSGLFAQARRDEDDQIGMERTMKGIEAGRIRAEKEARDALKNPLFSKQGSKFAVVTDDLVSNVRLSPEEVEIATRLGVLKAKTLNTGTDFIHSGPPQQEFLVLDPDRVDELAKRSQKSQVGRGG